MDPGVEMSGWTVDPYSAKFEDGWIWGMGAHDDKGGCVAAVCALEAIVRSGTQLKGDVLMTPVIAHKLGGAGTRALLRHGVKADLCINMEHSNNTIANVCVGVVMVRLVCSAPELFFRYSPEARAAYINPIEQQMEIVRRIGPSLTPIAPAGWMTFTPHPELPGFPTHTFDIIHKEHYYFKSATGRSTRECELTLQFRTVPGPDGRDCRGDLKRLLARIKQDHPAFNCVLEIPARGTEQTWNQLAMVCPSDHPAGRRAGRRPDAWPRGSRPSSARTGASAMSATATSSRKCSVSRPCNTVPAISASTRSGRHPTSGCASPTSSRPPKPSRMPRSDCAADPIPAERQEARTSRTR